MHRRKLTAFCFLFFFVASLIGLVQPVSAQLGDQLLVPGMRGNDVQELQRHLLTLGYAAGQVDGIFGNQTLQAVREFQANNGLTVDGKVGVHTANAILQKVNQNQGTVSRGLKISGQDRYNLARLVYGEARGESFEGQVAVAAVALNRLQSGKFGNSLQQVIFQPGAFTAVSDKQFYLTPDANAYQAADAALRGWDPTNGAIYYWNPATATSKWVWSRTIIKRIGKHVFAI